MSVQIIYSSYTDAQKRATDKWNKKNWDKVLAAERERYYKRKERLYDFFQLAKLIEAVRHKEFIPKPPKKNKYQRDD